MKEYNGYLEWAIDKIDETFASDDSKFRKYLRSNSLVTEWLIVSDYCLHDKKKPNNSLAFSIMPYPHLALKLCDVIKVIAPTDIKNTTHINKDFLNFLNMREFYNICILMKENTALIKNKDDVILTLDGLIKVYEKWKKTTLEEIKQYDERIKKLKKLKNSVNKNSFSHRLFSDCCFLSFFVAYLASVICQYTSTNKISWASDRDSMLTSFDGFTFDQVFMNYHCICEYRKIDSSAVKFYFWTQNNDELWFDELIRIPDYIASTFADCDIKENSNTHDKFIPIIDNVAASNERFELREIGFGKDVFHNKNVIIQHIP